jgi:hypothetical protein
MRTTHFNCTPLQWSRVSPTIRLSGRAARHQKSYLATTGVRTQTTVLTIRHPNIFATRTACFHKKMPCEKTFRRDSSTHVANSTASTLPTTISGDATVAQVTEMLSAHRKDIEAISQSPRRRRELASARNVGLQALTWLQQLHGLDEEYILSRQLYDDLGWLLVAESSEEALISWLLKEGSRMLSAGTFARVKRENYHDSDTHSIRNRRRHWAL